MLNIRTIIKPEDATGKCANNYRTRVEFGNGGGGGLYTPQISSTTNMPLC